MEDEAVDIRQVRFFIQASEDKSLSLAAEHLFISEQALSKSIARLEQELGVKLFTRHNKGITLTEFGNEFRAEALAYVEHHDHILEYFQSVKNEPKKTLTVGIGAGLMDQWLPKDLFLNYIRDYRELELNLISFAEEDYHTPSYMMYQYDLVLCSGYVPSESWDVLFQRKRPIRVIMREGHPLANVEYLMLHDLQHQYLAAASFNTPVQKHLINMLQDLQIVPNIRFSPAEISLVNSLILDAGLVCFFGGDPDILPKGVIYREIIDFNETWDLYLLVRKEHIMSPEAKELVSRIKKGLGEK